MKNGYKNVTDDKIEDAVTVVLKQKVSQKQSEDVLLAKTLQKIKRNYEKEQKGDSCKACYGHSGIPYCNQAC